MYVYMSVDVCGCISLYASRGRSELVLVSLALSVCLSVCLSVSVTVSVSVSV